MKKLIVSLLVASTIYCYGQLQDVVHDEFDDDRYGWWTGERENYSARIEGGKFVIRTLKEKSGAWFFISPYIDGNKDWRLEATFLQLDGGDNYGIGFIWGHNSDSKKNNNFTFSTNGNYIIDSSDTLRKDIGEWVSTSLVKPMGRTNKLAVEQKGGRLFFYLNESQIISAPPLPWFGHSIGVTNYTNMTLHIDNFIFRNDVKINLPTALSKGLVKENLGTGINTKYDEIAPKISADGRLIYFSRKESPDNLGGVTDKEDLWVATSNDGQIWQKARNVGTPINSESTDNIASVSIDGNTFLYCRTEGFQIKTRTSTGWSEPQDLGMKFKNEHRFMEGNLSPDGKAIIFTAQLKTNLYYDVNNSEKDIFVCIKKDDDTWGNPVNLGKMINSKGSETSPFMAADGRTLYFSSDGRPGFGDEDVFMAKRMGDSWSQWTEPVNLGPEINTSRFDAYYTLPASGDYAYMATSMNSYGAADIVRVKLPKEIKPDPVVLVRGKVLNAKTQQPVEADIIFENLVTGKEAGEAISDPKSGSYKISLPYGVNYGIRAEARGYLSVNENLELTLAKNYAELEKNLYLAPIEIGQTVQMKNLFFVQSKPALKPESYPELDRLVEIMRDNPKVEIELSGHTDNRGDPSANYDLSDKRVIAVMDYIQGKGIDRKRMSGQGYGGSRPLMANDTDEHRQMNRRVEFKITKN